MFLVDSHIVSNPFLSLVPFRFVALGICVINTLHNDLKMFVRAYRL